MNEQRKFTVTFSKDEVVQAMKRHFPDSVTVQAMPKTAALVVGNGSVSVSWTRGAVGEE